MKSEKLFSKQILFVIILTYILMLLSFLWVSNIGHLNAFILTIPFLLMTLFYIIKFINFNKR
ncbi:hypothetical protein BMJ13_08515 [Staphylococcus saprophyticus]|nr:hypothetical protein BMJ13_08515 [Staphylococcus saprophyticus]